MKFRFVTVELFRQRKRVRRAERVLQQDKARMSRATNRFLHDVVASPAGLATCAALGFCFDRLRGRRGTNSDSGNDNGSGGLLARASSLMTLAFWVRRMIEPLARPGAAGSGSAAPESGSAALESGSVESAVQ